METLPNPFGGVNTHLKRIVAYVLGIVRVPIAFYTPPFGPEELMCSRLIL